MSYGIDNDISTDINKKNDSSFKFDLDLGDELNYSKNSPLKNFSFWYRDFNANLYKFYNSHPLLGYSMRRILYGLAMLVFAIVIMFFLIRFVTDDSQYVPDTISKIMPGNDSPGNPQYDAFMQARLKLFGVDGSLLHQLFTYLKNLTPFIPKNITTYETYQIQIEVIKPELMPTISLSDLELLWKQDNHNLVLEGIKNNTLMDNGIYKVIITNFTSHQKTLWVYLGVIYSGQLGNPGIDVINDLFAKSIPYSFILGGIAVLISYILGVPIGILSARYKGRKTDSVINGINILLIAVPAVVIVIGLSLLSSKVFGNSMTFALGSFWTRFWPIMAITTMLLPPIVIYTRRYVVDEMTSDYTKFAYAKGVGANKVFYLHIFRNAGIRIIKQFPIDLAFTLFGASILTETQWGIPGMSKNIITGVEVRDSFVILDYIAFASFVQIFSSLISDLLMVWLDPRVSLAKK